MSDNKYFGGKRTLTAEEIAIYYRGANDFRVWILDELERELTTNIHWSGSMVAELAHRIGLTQEPYFILGSQDSPN